MVNNGGLLKVFLSYSHEDEELKTQLDTHLSLLKRLEVIETWNDRDILPGQTWEATLWAEFEAAHLILLLISSDFLASDFCYRQEMTQALERHDAGNARVVPIVIRACDWEDAPFGRIQALPTRARPVTSWPNRDEAWTDVVKGIRGAVGLQETRLASVGTETPAAPSEPGNPSISLSVSTQPMAGSLRTFQLQADADAIPNEGYIGAQTLLHCGDLLYRATHVTDEIIWPEAEMATALHNVTPSGLIYHGALSGLISPEPSFHIGPLFRITLQCPLGHIAESHSHRIHLIPLSDVNTSGAAFNTRDRQYTLASVGQADLPTLGVTEYATVVDIVCNP